MILGATREALCLISDIEPSDSEILWPPAFEEITIETPQAQRLTLLSEEPIFSLAPDADADADALERSIDFVDRRLEQQWAVANLRSLHFFSIHTMMQIRQKASERLQANWRIFFSNPKHVDLSPQEPPYFLEWSARKKIDIPWLDWAVESEYLPSGLAGDKSELPDESAIPDEKISPELQANIDQEVEELRDKAKKVAIKLKIDGIPPKRITVERICRDLLNEKFESGKDFRLRWDSIEGMRSYLKGEHHPKKSEGFRKAKSSRGKFGK